jgi:hypothetical protein
LVNLTILQKKSLIRSLDSAQNHRMRKVII